MREVKIATLGAATLDVFLAGKDLHAKRDVRTHDYVEQFPLGAKLELDNVTFSTGGGATNAAVTFARQGYSTSILAKIGDDLPGREVLQDLHNHRVKTDQIVCDLDGATGYSTLLVAPNGERTILVFRGASEDLQAEEFKLSKLEADWLYISSLAGNLDLLKTVLTAAVANKIKVALNPGSKELVEAEQLQKLLPQVQVLIANKQEFQKLFKEKEPAALLKAATRYCRYAVLTDGKNGSWTSDGRQVYRAGMYKDVKVIDRTGAGDAYGSGFVSSLAAEKPIEHALSFASANASSVVRYVGAKTGILGKNVKISDIKVVRSHL